MDDDELSEIDKLKAKLRGLQWWLNYDLEKVIEHRRLVADRRAGNTQNRSHNRSPRKPLKIFCRGGYPLNTYYISISLYNNVMLILVSVGARKKVPSVLAVFTNRTLPYDTRKLQFHQSPLHFRIT